MNKTDKEHQPDKQDDRDRPAPPAPRGNPETDTESVAKGREQLDKISGN